MTLSQRNSTRFWSIRHLNTTLVFPCRPYGLLLTALFTPVLISGCKQLKQGAIEAHSQTYSCPEDRIETRKRDDLDAYTLIVGASEANAEVKADPERLAVWQKAEAKKRNDWNSSVDVFETTGCGHATIHACYHPATMRSQGAANYAETTCIPIPMQARAP